MTLALKQIALLILLLVSLSNSINATTNILGAEITYKSDSAHAYTFYVTYYRLCSDSSLTNPSKDIRITNVAGGSSVSVNLTLVSIENVSVFCSRVKSSACSPQNTTNSDIGVEAHKYKVSVDFNKAPYDKLWSSSACEILFEINRCCRSSEITSGAANANFYTFSKINLCKAAINSSPQYLHAPIAFFCCNQPLYTTIGGYDYVDADSLSFAFANPLSAYSSPIKYNGAYAYNKPFKPYDPTGKGIINPNANPPIGIYLDPITGRLIHTPQKCDETTIAVIEIKEWRKNAAGTYEEIGITRRDMQFMTRTCVRNNSPEFTGPFTKKMNASTCLTKHTFEVDASDKVVVNPPGQPINKPDTLQFLKPHFPNGVTFKVENEGSAFASAEILIDASKIDITKYVTKPLMLEVGVADNNCANPAISYTVYSIFFDTNAVQALVKGSIINDENGNCFRDTLEKYLKTIRNVVDVGSKEPGYRNSKLTGTFEFCADTGLCIAKLFPNPWFEDRCVVDTLRVVKDSIHQVNFYTRLKPGIAGYVFSEDGKCSKVNKSVPIKYQMVMATPGPFYATTDVDGFYVLNVPPGKYEVQLINDVLNWKNMCRQSIQIAVDSNKTYFIDTFFNFHIRHFDLAISTSTNTGDRVRRSTDASAYVALYNVGELHVDSTILEFRTNSNKVDLSKSDKGWIDEGGGVYTIMAKDIKPGEYKTYNIIFNTASYSEGSTFSISANTNADFTKKDANKTDNFAKKIIRIVAPYDPNQKSATPDSIFTTNNRMLTYNIEFQNLGSISAIDVILMDTLPSNLNLSTLHFHHASAAYDYILSGNHLSIFFKNIHLAPSSQDYNASIGNVSFSLALKDDIFHETFVKNRVGIYFDYEDVVMTNQQINHFKSPIEFADTSKRFFCASDSIILPFKTNFEPLDNNAFILDITNSDGDLSTFQSLDTIHSMQQKGIFKIPVPAHLNHGKKYVLRIRSTNFATQVFEQNYLYNVEIRRLESPKIMLNPTNLCAGESCAISSDKAFVNNKVFVNNKLLSTTSNTTTIVKNLTDNDSLFIQVTDDKGCHTFTNTDAIKVFAKPTIQPMWDSVFCPKTSVVTFTNKVTLGVGRAGKSLYKWSFGDGSSQITAKLSEPIHIYPAAGKYPLSYTVFNEFCSDTIQQNIYFKHKPKAQFPNNSGLNCLNDSFRLSSTSTTEVGNISKLYWNLGDGTTSINRDLIYQYQKEGSYNVRLIVTDNYACADTLIQKIQIANAPFAKIWSSATDVCENKATIGFKAKITNVFTHLNWQIADKIYAVDSVEHLFMTSEKNEVTLIAFAANGCNDTVRKVINVYPKESPNFLMDSTLCDNLSITLKPPQQTPSTNYVWEIDKKIQVGTKLPIGPKQLSPGFHTIKLTTITNEKCYDNMEKSLHILPTPEAFGLASNFCSGLPTELHNNTQNYSNHSRFEIDWGDGHRQLDQNHASSFFHTYSSGNFTINFIAKTEGCESAVQIPVVINETPVADFTIDQNGTESFTFTNKSHNHQKSVWLFGEEDSITDNNNSVSYNFKTVGHHKITLLVTNNELCSDTLSKWIDILSKINKINFFIPNAFSPNNDQLNEQFRISPPKYIQSVDFHLFNRWGEKVLESTNPDQLLGEEMPAGLYMYSVQIVDILGTKHEFKGLLRILE